MGAKVATFEQCYNAEKRRRLQNIEAMTYILQKTEIKNASHKLIEVVKKLGEEKHAKMEELRSHTNFTYTIKV